MNTVDIMRIARQSGFDDLTIGDRQEQLRVFASIVVAVALTDVCCRDFEKCDKLCMPRATHKEREACAEICKKHADVYAMLEQNPTTKSAWAACIDNLDAIRARGQA